MAIHTLPTQFAPAERASKKRLQQQAAQVENMPMLRLFFDAVPDIVMILNEQRQIVFANRALQDASHLADIHAAIGLRPGEVLDCIHAAEDESGCGTTTFCKTCGAVQAILSSLNSITTAAVKTTVAIKTTALECRISTKNGDALDFLVHATPLALDGQKYSVFVIKDISDEKRRLTLEHVFFHDILNSAGALRGLADVMSRVPIDEKDDVASDISFVCDRLIDEVKSQQELVAAENNELQVTLNLIDTNAYLEELVREYQRHQTSRGRQVCLSPDTCEVSLFTDPVILRRVLGNMVKNALEACQQGETVTLGCRAVKGTAAVTNTAAVKNTAIEFWVHNPGFIPDDVSLQIFQRSFSTKGPGRGLGTYSIKLLGERYLHGKVSFTTSPDDGTIFKIILPGDAAA